MFTIVVFSKSNQAIHLRWRKIVNKLVVSTGGQFDVVVFSVASTKGQFCAKVASKRSIDCELENFNIVKGPGVVPLIDSFDIVEGEDRKDVRTRFR